MVRRTTLALTVLFAAATCLHADDWPQFLGPNRDGISGETGLVKSWPKDGPKQIWKKAVGEGYSGPVIAGERLIVFHRTGDKEVVECWSAADAKFQWKFDYDCDYKDGFGKGNGPRSTPVISGNRVVTLGADGALSCIDVAKGTKIWQRNVNKDYRVPPSYFGVGTSPVVDDGLVLVNVGGKNAGIVAFGLEDGKEAWKATGEGASYSSPVIRAIDGVKHAVFFTREGAVILDPKTGDVRYRQRWRARYDASVNAATPLVLGNEVFFSTSYETGALLLKVRKNGADEVWTSDDLMGNHYNTCIAADGHLYGFDGRQETGPSFRCVDLKNKKVAWEKKRFGCGSMILAEGNLIVLMEDGNLLLTKAAPAEFEELARAKVCEAGPVRAQIALSGGRLYARDQKSLYCFDLRK